jgi:hypothetical protein
VSADDARLVISLSYLIKASGETQASRFTRSL